MKASYITAVERIGIEKGIQIGEGGSGEINLLMALLNAKFQVVPDNLLYKINSADTDTLLKFAKRTVNCDTIEEVLADN